MAFSKAFETVRIHRFIRVRARERIERRLRQAEKMKTIERMAGGIAHDFNNILMAVGGNVELVAGTVAPDHPAHEDLNAAKEAVETGRRLVQQLLDLARAKETRAEYVDIKDFLDHNAKLLGSMVSRQTPLEVSVEPEVGGVMIAPGQLTQILMNLIINAREATPGGGTIKVQASAIPSQSGRLTGVRSPREVAISVTDEGTGIPPEVLEHVFEPFFTTKAEQGGSGLGLATLYSIVHKAGGHVEVESEVGRGTRFHVRLPRCEG
jgi:two-component system cell cycle sensor histidine kinase/response regulator CckA